ncbi:MAG: Rne/Rng family ribonuclease [Desulfuromonadaceae bacterium]|nr:Rne/Rng family ribonuclease [Desulfuromonas sp.]MDY0185969.1 Rne/Rng family ribonuclease [Desulfuromonadaceae bacterium]
MGKKMLINATLSGEGRVAIVEDGLLTELDIEVAGSENTKGNIYKAEVVRIEPGLQAAFVNYGAQRHGFLQIGDIHPDLWSAGNDDSKPRPPINEILRRGQKILVQVVKEERSTKGAAVTTELSLAGRYMVLMANSRSRGISRKIEKDSTRKKIKEVLKGLNLPDEMGYIIRTAAIDQPPEELKRDFNYLFNTYKNIIAQAENATAPALIYQESSLVLRSVRDYFTPDMDEVLIDDKDVFIQTREFFKTVMPDQVKLVKLHQERRPIFSRYQIEEQIAQLTSNSVTLPSGGSIVLDQTEALVAIDVNSGKVSSEQNIEATAYLVNVEAATEIARQLRLRDLGGLIVIDFIDMRQRKNARKVEKTLELALKQDKARVTQGRISTLFGLLEMSRQRIKPNLGAASYSNCPHCNGTGLMRSSESRAISLLRRIQAGTAKGKIEKVVATVALDVGITLLNEKRSELRDLELQQHIKVIINPRPDFLSDQVELDFIKDAGEQELGASEQKALVDSNFSDRGKNFDFSDTATGVDAETDNDEEKLPGSDSDAKASSTDSTENSTDESPDEDQKAATQPKHPRRSRPSRHRRPRTSSGERNKENNEQSAQPDAPVEAGQAQASDADKHATSQDATQHPDTATTKSAQQGNNTNPSSNVQPVATQIAASTATTAAPNGGGNATSTEGKISTDTVDAKPQPRKTEATQTESAATDVEAEKPKRRRAPRRPAAKKKEAEAPQADAATTTTEAKTAAKTVTKTDVASEEKPQTSAATPAKPAAAPAKPTPAPTTAKPVAVPAKPATVKAADSAASEVAKPAPKSDSAPASAPKAEPAPKAVPAPKLAAKAESAPAEKTAPERKRRTTAKASASSRSTSKKEADSDIPATTEPEAAKAAEEKKAPRRRTTSARSKTTTSKAKTEADKADVSVADTTTAAVSATTEEKTAVKRAPRRTTTRRTPAAAKTDAAKTDAKTSTVKADTAVKNTPAAEASKPAQNSQPPRETAASKPAVEKKSENDA